MVAVGVRIPAARHVTVTRDKLADKDRRLQSRAIGEDDLNGFRPALPITFVDDGQALALEPGGQVETTDAVEDNGVMVDKTHGRLYKRVRGNKRIVMMRE